MDEAGKPKRPGAFDFLARRPHDILVYVKPAGERNKVRKLQIYYAEHGSFFSFEHSLQDVVYGGDRDQLLRGATKALLNEVKARSLAAFDFIVWFYDNEGRQLLESEAGKLARDEPAWQRHLDKLILVDRTLEESEAARFEL